MRIGIITGEYPPMQGGVGAYSHILARTLASQGHTIDVLTSTAGQLADSGIMLTNSVRTWRLGTLRTTRQWAKTSQVDIINLQFQTAAFQMSPWIHFLPQYLRGVPVVTTFHDLRFPYLFPKAGPLRERIVMHLARTSAGVIVTNHEDMARVQDLPAATLIPIGSNILTPPPADFDRRAWREKAGVGDDELLLAYFGFINHSKGVDVLLQALRMLRGEIPAKLVIIGGRTGTSDPTNAAYADQIDQLIADLDLTRFIHRTGYVDDSTVSAYLTAADVVVLPFRDGASYRRGSLMAAVHHNCAIVTTHPQVEIPAFVDGENMRFGTADDSEALANILHQLYDSPAARDKLRAGTRALSQQFDWSHIAQDCACFFERFTRNKQL